MVDNCKHVFYISLYVFMLYIQTIIKKSLFLLLKLLHEKIDIHKDTTRCIKFVHFNIYFLLFFFTYILHTEVIECKSDLTLVIDLAIGLYWKSKFMSLKLPTDINVVVDFIMTKRTLILTGVLLTRKYSRTVAPLTLL